MPGELIPIVAIMMVFGIPLVGILTTHQRKMAELIHGGQQENQMNAALMHELQALRAEIASLRETVNQQAIALDDLKSLPTRDIQERIGETSGR